MPRPRIHADRTLTRAEIQKAYRQRQAAARLQELQQKGLPPAPAIATMPGTARWNSLLEQARSSLTTCRDEMQGYYDERSEAWQESDRGAELQERIDEIDTLLTDLEGVRL